MGWGVVYTPSIFTSTEILQLIPVIASCHPIVTLGAHSLLQAILRAACSAVLRSGFAVKCRYEVKPLFLITIKLCVSAFVVHRFFFF